jgi:hypothetical protein
MAQILSALSLRSYASAANLADHLTAVDEDGWDYVVREISREKGYYVIDVFDIDDEKLGTLT